MRRPLRGLRRLSSTYADEAAAGQLLRVADELRAQSAVAASEEERQSALSRLREHDLPIADPGHWVRDPYFTGGFRLWPKLEDLFVQIVEERKTIIVLRGSAGWGKSTLGRKLIERSAYEIGCYAAPHQELGQFTGWRPLRIPLMAVDKDKAREQLFEPLKNSIRRSPWFSEFFRGQRRLYNDTGVNFLQMTRAGEREPVLRISPDPTSPNELVGDDVVAGHFTECNKYDVVEDSARARRGTNNTRFDVAMEIFDELRVRLVSRFHKPFAPPVRLIFDSSERYEDDFITQLQPILENLGIPFGIYSHSNWHTRPDEDRPPYFWFAKPSKGASAEVLENDSRRFDLVEAGRDVVQVPEGAQQIYLRMARENPDRFSQDMVGAPTDAISRFITDPAAIDRTADERAIWLADHGITREPQWAPDEFILGRTAIDWASITEHDTQGLGFRPRILPNEPRFAHFDLATSGDDFVGFAMGCLAGARHEQPLVWIDFCWRILRREKEYDFELLRDVVEQIRQHGFVFEQISFDTYQSFDFGQQLRQRRIKVERIPMHSTIDPFLAMRGALYHRRLLFDAQPTVRSELVQLERRVLNGREFVQHRPGGHDDAVDALTGVVWAVVQSAQRKSSARVARPHKDKMLAQILQHGPLPDSAGQEAYTAALSKVLHKMKREEQREERRAVRQAARQTRRAARLGH